MLVARLDSHKGIADIAHIDPRRLLRDAFELGDTWFVTGDFLRMDQGGDYWFVDRLGDMIATLHGPVASQRIEDALYVAAGVSRCLVVGIDEPSSGYAQPMAAIALVHPTATPDLHSIAEAVAILPDYARPRRLRIIAELPMNDGFRALKSPIIAQGFADGPGVYRWDDLSARYVATV